MSLSQQKGGFGSAQVTDGSMQDAYASYTCKVNTFLSPIKFSQ
jgi:hypothetical protein